MKYSFAHDYQPRPDLMPRDNVARRTVMLYAGLLGGLALTIPTTVLVARGLGPADKGAWTLIVQTIFLVEIAAAFGAGAYYIVQLNSGRTYEAIFGTAIAQAVGEGLIAAFATGALLDLIAGEHSGRGTLVPASLAVLFLVTSRQVNYLAIGNGRASIFAIATLGQAAMQLALVAVTLAARKLDLAAALWSFAAGSACRLMLGTTLLLYRCIPPVHLDLALLREALLFGSRRVVSELEDAVNTRIPLFVLPLFQPLLAVGVYSIALGLSEVVGQGGIAASTATLASFVHRRTQDDAFFLVRVGIWTNGLLALLSVAAVPLIAWVFGAAYAAAGAEFVVLLPTVPVLAFNRMCTSSLSARGAVSTVAVAGAISLVSVTLLCFVLTPVFGPTGASLALLGGLGTQSSLYFAYFHRRGAAASDLLLLNRRDLSSMRTLILKWMTMRTVGR